MPVTEVCVSILSAIHIQLPYKDTMFSRAMWPCLVLVVKESTTIGLGRLNPDPGTEAGLTTIL